MAESTGNVMWRVVIFGAAVLVLTGCPEFGKLDRPLTTEVPDNPTWSQHVKPILDVYCNECHSVPAQQLAPGTLRLDVCETVAGLPGAQSQAFRIVFRTIEQIPSPMPPLDYAAGYPSAAEQEILQRWVDQGASCEDMPVVNNGTADMDTTGMDMTTVVPDMNAAVDMGTDMGMDMAVDLGPPAATWPEVATMLNDKCSGCHGFLGGTPAEIQAQVENRAGFVTPNLPESSDLFLRVSSQDDNFRMPRPVGTPIDQELVDAVESWILDGAPYN